MTDPSVNADTIEQTKQQIRALVSEIAQLSKSELEPNQYYAAFLQRVVQALAAVGGAVWMMGEGQTLRCAYQINVPESLLDRDTDDAKRHEKLLQYILQQGEPQLIPPRAGDGAETSGANPTDHLLVLGPLVADGKLEGVVEIFQRPDAQPATQRGYLRFLMNMVELAGDWLKSQKLRQFSDRHSLWGQADHFARLVHESLDVRGTSFTVVNEARRMIGCDRVSVAIKRGRKCKIEAISGQDTLENRSNIVNALGTLATKVVATGESLWFEGETEDLPPQIERAIDQYIEESYAKSVTVLPLRRPDKSDDLNPEAQLDPDNIRQSREVIGAIIIEQIETDLPKEVIHPRIDLVYEHTARALANAIDHHDVFLMPVWKTIGKSKWLVKTRQLPKTLAVAGGILAVLLGLCLIPGDFKMKAEGRLNPVETRRVFAEQPGDVVQILPDQTPTQQSSDQIKVSQGERLCVLRNTDLQIEHEQVYGEYSAAQRELDEVVQQLINNVGLSPTDKTSLELTQGRLEKRIESLEKQLALVQDKRERLTVTSPIDGIITSWDVKRQLQNRPVQAGAVLMEIADTNKAWEVELSMPENRSGKVDVARKRLEPGLRVTFILAGEPGTQYEGKIVDVADRSQVADDQKQTVKIRVALEAGVSQQIEKRPNMEVTARVFCGKKPLGWCWFHEAWEWLQKNVFF